MIKVQHIYIPGTELGKFLDGEAVHSSLYGSYDVEFNRTDVRKYPSIISDNQITAESTMLFKEASTGKELYRIEGMFNSEDIDAALIYCREILQLETFDEVRRVLLK